MGIIGRVVSLSLEHVKNTENSIRNGKKRDAFMAADRSGRRLLFDFGRDHVICLRTKGPPT